MLFGKFGIDFGSKQVYTAKHCLWPKQSILILLIHQNGTKNQGQFVSASAPRL